MIAKGCGYKYAKSVSTEEDIKREIAAMKEIDGPAFLEIKIQAGATKKDLIRPDVSAKDNKKMLMEYL